LEKTYAIIFAGNDVDSPRRKSKERFDPQTGKNQKAFDQFFNTPGFLHQEASWKMKMSTENNCVAAIRNQFK
jgi:hypothetical protein